MFTKRPMDTSETAKTPSQSEIEREMYKHAEKVSSKERDDFAQRVNRIMFEPVRTKKGSNDFVDHYKSDLQPFAPPSLK